jgi:2-oxoglutarate dehydrogenase E1 component
VYYDLCDYRERTASRTPRSCASSSSTRCTRERLAEIAEAYGRRRLVWCQEESQNMGAWSWIAPQLEDVFGRKPLYAGRDASSSPAVGSLASTRMELAGLLKDAFTL